MGTLSPAFKRIIKTEIEKIFCKVHNQHAKVTFSGMKANITECCCEEFQGICLKRLEEATAKALEQELLKSFKKK